MVDLRADPLARPDLARAFEDASVAEALDALNAAAERLAAATKSSASQGGRPRIDDAVKR